MKKKHEVMLFIFFGLVVGYSISQEMLPLPQPQISPDYPLMKLLKERQSSRNFRDKPLTVEQLSDLLWAAYGINRPEQRGRTAPSAWNHQEIDLYVFTEEGVWLYLPQQHALQKLLSQDLRAQTGVQPFVEVAPVTIVLVADFTRMVKSQTIEEKRHSAAITAGCIVQNIYLFGAERKLGVVARGSVPSEGVRNILKLSPDQHIMVGVTIGFTEEPK